MTPYTFVLASQSPRRRALIGLIDAPVELAVSGADEEGGIFDGPADYVLTVARRKAEATAPRLSPSGDRRILIAADTTVALADEIMAKPVDADDARRMLRALRGGPHDVFTGLCLIDLSSGTEWAGVQRTVVIMRSYSDAEIDAYIAGGDPMDKAGAYAIQHTGFHPVSALDGCYLSVVGLSVCQLVAALDDLDVRVRGDADGLIAAHDGHPCPLLPRALAILAG